MREKKQTNTSSRLLAIYRERVTGDQFATWPLIAYLFVLLAIVGALYSYKLYRVSALDTLVPGLFASAISLSPLWIIRLTQYNTEFRFTRPWFASLLFLAIGWARGIVLSFLLVVFDGAPRVENLGAILAPGINMFYFAASFSLIAGLRSNHLVNKKQLAESSAALEEQRLQAPQILDSQNKLLRSKAIESIKPSLEKIARALTDQKPSGDLVRLMEQTISEKIRPLGQALQAQVETVVHVKNQIRVLPKLTSIPKLFNPRLVFDPTGAVLIFIPLIVLGEVVISGPQALPSSLGRALLSYLLLLVCKLLIPNREFSTAISVVIIICAEVLGDVLTSVILTWLSLTPLNLLETFLGQIGLGPIWFLCIAYIHLMIQNSETLLSESVSLNQSLEAEKAILERNIWVARRNWSYFVHGRIQSTLSAILTRTTGQKLTAQIKQEINSDLEKIIELLSNLPEPDADIFMELENLKILWRGIANLEVEVKDDVVKYLNKSPELRFAVNEIVKEGVSNAIRHGHSKRVKIKMALTSNELEIDICNETEVEVRDNPRSLGSKMFDELTSFWSLAKDADNKVHLLARLSLPK